MCKLSTENLKYESQIFRRKNIFIVTFLRVQPANADRVENNNFLLASSNNVPIAQKI